MDYEQAQPVIDSSVLNAKRPWYSAKYGDNIKPGATTAWGNTQTDPYGAAEEAGSKQYELTNHLGNVQTTVGDNRYAVADESTDTIKAFHPVIRSAYDYYPFGMLMPGRYVSDTSEHCVTISRPTWAWKEVTVACWDVYSWRWPGYTPINKGTAVVSGDAVEINAPAAGDGVSFDFPVTANVQQELDIDVERVNLNNKASVQVMELEGADWVTLAEAPINVVSGGISIPFTPKANTVRVIWNGPIVIWVRKHCISKLEWVEEDQLVTVCDEDKDKYRFGFNGQEKVNEWAGIGNFNEFKERGQDTRIGRFLSVDPIASQYPWNSSYAFAENDVIRAKDLEGAERLIMTDVNTGTHTAKLTIKKDIEILNTQNLPYQYKKINANRLKKNFSFGNTTLYVKSLPVNGSPVQFTNKRAWKKGKAYSLKVVYDVTVKLVDPKDQDKSFDGNRGLISTVTTANSSSPFKPNDRLTGAVSGADPGNNTSVVLNPYFNHSISPEDVLTHEVGDHNMKEQKHKLDADNKPIYPQQPTLESNKSGSIYPVDEDTKQIINNNLKEGRLDVDKAK